ncbi:MAG: carboxypeptidase-like regulatory domain-containing protein [Holophagae bacterium]|jgi:hypothetical protein
MHRRIAGLTASVALAAVGVFAAPQVLGPDGRTVDRATVISGTGSTWVRQGAGVPVRVPDAGGAVLRLPELATARLLVLDAATGEPLTAGRLRWLGIDAPDTAAATRWMAPAGRLDLPCFGGESVSIGARGYRPTTITVDVEPRRHTVLLEPNGTLDLELRPPAAGRLWLARADDVTPFAPFRRAAQEHEIAADGTLLVRDLDAAAEYRGVVWVAGRAPVVGRIDALPRRLELTLSDGLAVSGVVHDRHGAPLAGADVVATGRIAELGDFRYRQKGRTDTEGRFTVGGLLAGEIEVEVCAVGRACAERAVALDVTAAPGAIRFELEPGHDLRLVVRDEYDRPAARAEVIDTGAFRRFEADDTGAVVFRGVTSGDTIDLKIFADGLRPWRGSIDTDHAEVVLRIPLGGGLEWPILTGRAVAPGDATAIWIRINDRGREVAEGEARWDTELRAVVADGLDIGRYRLQARLPGAATLTSEIVELGPGERVRLPAAVPDCGLAIAGRVVAADTADPVAGARVTCEPGSPQEFRKPVWLERLPAAVSDADGLFLLDGLDSGRCRTVVRAPGFAAWRRDGVEPDEIGLDLGLIELDGGMTVVGRVVDRSSRPQTGVTVEITEDAAYAYLADAAATTDHDGWFRADGLPAGRWAVTASTGDATARTTVEGGAGDTVTVELRLGGLRLEGQVWLGDRPAAGGHLVLTTGAARGDGVVVMVQTDADMRRFFGVDQAPLTVIVGGDGRFAVDGVTPGVYTASYTPPEPGASPVSRELVVPQTELHRCVIRFSDAGVDGVVVDPDGRPVAGAVVRVMDPEGRLVADGFSDGDGLFRFTGFEVGVVRLTATHGEFADATPVDIELRAGDRTGPITLELGPPDGAELTLTVASSAGSLAGAPVYLVGTTTLTAFTDGQGVATFTGVEPGRYRPCAAAFGGAAGCGAELELDDGDRRQVAVALGRGGVIELLIGPVERTPALRLLTADGIDLTSMLMMVSPPLPGPDGLRIGPLRADDYRVVVTRSGVTREGSVTTIEQETVTLDLR